MLNASGLTRRVGTLVALCFALALVGACDLPGRSSDDGRDPYISSTVTRDFAVGASPELVVNAELGAIVVVAGDAGRISVEAVKRAKNQTALDRIELGMSQEGDIVRLEYRVPQGMGAISSGNPTVWFRVTAPAGTKASLMTETGAIDADGLSTGLSAETNTGAISTVNVKGPQTLRTAVGAIAAIGAEGTVQATTGTGKISVEGSLAGENWARTNTGAVTVKLPSGANLKVTAKGTNTKNDFGLSSQGGQLSGNIGAGTGGSLDASTTTGTVQILKQ